MLVSVVLCAWCTTEQAGAQVVTFDTSGTTTTTAVAATFNATQQASGISGTPQLSRSSDLGTSNAVAGTFTSSVTSSSNFTDTINTSKTYVGFTVVPVSGTVLFATEINASTQGTTAAPNSYAFAYSTDNFQTYNASAVATGVTSSSTVARTYDITDLITNDTLSVRLLNYGSTRIGGTTAPASGGGYRVSAVSVTGTTVTAASGSITLAAATEIRDGGALSLGGTISGGFAVNKAGAGTLTLSGSNTYGTAGTTGTTLSAGTLLVNNAAGSGTGAGNVSVGSGTALGGTGTISGAVSVAGTLAPGATTAAGSFGTITTGALTLTSTATLAFDLTNTSTKDLVALSGNMLAVGGTLALTLPNTTATGIDYSQTYAVATGVSGLTGSFSSVTGYDTTDYAATLALNGTEYDLSFVPIAVPEPATLLGGVLLVGALGWKQRRRSCGKFAGRRAMANA